VTLHIEAGVEIEFYPSVGILVLGTLRAMGTERHPIKMRPIAVQNMQVVPIGRHSRRSSGVGFGIGAKGKTKSVVL
jgi:hypothetical protein